MDLEFWATTDVGRVRDHNEDNFLVDKRLKLFVVCDGMGGHAAGEVASAMSVKIVREVIAENRETFDLLHQDPDNIERRNAVKAICDAAVSEACQRVFLSAQADPAKRGMGTTCSMLLLQDGRAFVGHVGDSRIYLLRDQQVHQVTEDHSLLNEMIRLGKIKPGEEHMLPHKNAVTRAVGVNEFVEVDTFDLDVFSGDQFLVCSDGLCGYFEEDDQIIDLLNTEDPREATERCIDFANEGGGKDNITSIIVRVTGDNGKRDVHLSTEALKATPYFQYLSHKEMQHVVSIGERVEYSAGMVVREETAPSENMFLVLNGSVEVSRGANIVGVYGPTEHFGESSLIDEDARPMRVVALVDSVLLTLKREKFMELLRIDAELAVKLLWNFVQTFTIRMRESELKLENRVKMTIPERTPPSTNLDFEEDRKSDFPAPISRGDEEVTVDIAVNNDELASALEQDKADAEEDDEDLRSTVQLDMAAPSEEKTQTMPSLQARVEDPVEEDMGVTMPPKKPGRISGESVVSSGTPKSQIMKKTKTKTKLVWNGDDEETAATVSLSDRLKDRLGDSDDKTTEFDDL